MNLLKKLIYKIYNLYPPFFGAGISIDKVSDDEREIHVSLKHRFYNKNYVGTAYGGSIYSMTDPFYMLILIKLLGRDYIVWDKAAEIKFIKPGRTNLKAVFRVSEETINEIKNSLKTKRKLEPEFIVEVTDENGELVAIVKKILYVRKKH